MPEIERYAGQRAFRVQGPNAPGQNKSRPRLARPTELAAEWRALFVERPVWLWRDVLQLSFSTVEIFPKFMNRLDSALFLSGSSARNPASSLDVLQKDLYRPSCRSSRRNDRWPKPNQISCRARSTC